MQHRAIQQRKVRSPPPVTITDATYDVVRDAIADTNIKYQWKIRGQRIQLCMATEEERLNMMKLLHSKNVYHFTHPPRGEPMLRTIFHGVPNEPSAAQNIMDELTTLGHPPLEVRAIPSKRNALHAVWPSHGLPPLCGGASHRALHCRESNQRVRRSPKEFPIDVKWWTETIRPPGTGLSVCKLRHGEAP